MRTKILSIGIIIVAIIIGISLSFNPSEYIDHEYTLAEFPEPDVIMPTKVSRPGCEETNTCYIPTHITINVGENVTWQNQDAAFHSVTSGKYDSPTGLFDSGYLDPDQVFSYAFSESGTYDYYCTLHPWMEGQVIVK